MTLNCQEKKAICHKVFSPIEYSCTQCASPLLPEKTPWKPRNTFISYLTHVCNPVWDHEMHNHMYNKVTWFSSIQLFTKSKMTSWYVCSDPTKSFSLNLLYVRCPRLWLKMVPSVCSTSWEDSPESSYVLQLHVTFTVTITLNNFNVDVTRSACKSWLAGTAGLWKYFKESDTNRCQLSWVLIRVKTCQSQILRTPLAWFI